jgi:hypothetical protein
MFKRLHNVLETRVPHPDICFTAGKNSPMCRFGNGDWIRISNRAILTFLVLLDLCTVAIRVWQEKKL